LQRRALAVGPCRRFVQLALTRNDSTPSSYSHFLGHQALRALWDFPPQGPSAVRMGAQHTVTTCRIRRRAGSRATPPRTPRSSRRRTSRTRGSPYPRARRRPGSAPPAGIVRRPLQRPGTACTSAAPRRRPSRPGTRRRRTPRTAPAPYTRGRRFGHSTSRRRGRRTERMRSARSRRSARSAHPRGSWRR
jgi:hypothetical protein